MVTVLIATLFILTLIATLAAVFMVRTTTKSIRAGVLSHDQLATIGEFLPLISGCLGAMAAMMFMLGMVMISVQRRSPLFPEETYLFPIMVLLLLLATLSAFVGIVWLVRRILKKAHPDFHFKGILA